MSFGVFLYPQVRSANAAGTAEAVHSAQTMHTVGLFYPPPATGYALHTDQLDFARPPQALTVPGTSPQEGSLLINLVADLINMPDSLSVDSANIPAITFFTEHFCFSNPQGACIGWPVYNISCDTVLLRCAEWAWEACLNCELVFEPSFDSMNVQCNTTSIDTGRVTVYDGTLLVLPTLVGDIDGGGSLPIDIADLVYMVDGIFDGGPARGYPLTTDCNGDGSVVFVDVVCRVDTTSLSD